MAYLVGQPLAPGHFSGYVGALVCLSSEFARDPPIGVNRHHLGGKQVLLCPAVWQRPYLPCWSESITPSGRWLLLDWWSLGMSPLEKPWQVQFKFNATLALCPSGSVPFLGTKTSNPIESSMGGLDRKLQFPTRVTGMEVSGAILLLSFFGSQTCVFYLLEAQCHIIVTDLGS